MFSREVLTGIQGRAAVGVILPGLMSPVVNVNIDEAEAFDEEAVNEGEHADNVLELLNLPFEGSVTIGKGSLFEGDDSERW